MPPKISCFLRLFCYQTIPFPCDRLDPIGKPMAAKFFASSRDTLPDSSFFGFIVSHDILTYILFGKRHIWSVEELFQQSVGAGTKNVLSIFPGNDIVIAESASGGGKSGVDLLLGGGGFSGHQFDNRFFEMLYVIVQ